jgi:hypothetical protein
MPQKLTPEIILAAIAGFDSQKTHIDSQIAELRSLLAGNRTEAAVTETGRPKRKVSAAARRKMAASQRARYAKLKQGSESTQPANAKPKRKVSRASRAKMAQAQRKRWAAIKKAFEPQPAAPKGDTRKKAAPKEAA